MKQSINYIDHHRQAYFKMSEDNRLSPFHISLYNALFMIWNECGFDTELSVNRNDMMKLSKIGNANTYTKILRDLDLFGYVVYKPSFNPIIGSKVTIITFGKGGSKGSDKGTVKGGSKGGSKGGNTLYKQLNKETNKQDADASKPPTDKESTLKFLTFFNAQILKHKGKEGKFSVLSKTDLNNLKKLKESFPDHNDWLNAFSAMYESPWVQENNMLTPTHFLVNANFQKYLNTEVKSKNREPNEISPTGETPEEITERVRRERGWIV